MYRIRYCTDQGNWGQLFALGYQEACSAVKELIARSGGIPYHSLGMESFSPVVPLAELERNDGMVSEVFVYRDTED